MSLLHQAEEIIYRKKAAAENFSEKYYKKAMSIPEVAAAEKNYASLLPKLAKTEASGKEDTALSERFRNSLEVRRQVFKKHNIDDRLFTPAYSCPLCNDTGYRDGKACSCLRQIVNNLIQRQYGTDINQFRCFESVDLDSKPVYRQNLGRVYENIQKYAESFPNTKFKNLVFKGYTGTGKTYLASCMARKVMERGYTVIFLTAFKLNQIFLDYHTDFNGNFTEHFENLYSCDLLIIDDLGTENTFKNVTNEYLLSLISERITSGRHTLITTNFDGEQIRSRYDDRLYSRLLDREKTYTFDFLGDNLRQV